MAEVRWTLEASRWLKEIHDYIAEDSPQAALRIVRGIHGRIQVLESFPELGHRYTTTEKGDVRILLYGHYRIAYRVRTGLEAVEILGIFHGAMELETYLSV